MLEAIIKQTPKLKLAKSELKKIPETTGVYIFLRDKKAIYIGKAVNLKSRILSYFSTQIGPKTRSMVGSAEYLTYIKVSSELEALLLEAELIRSEQPEYNSVSKDDKHPLYIKISREDYPTVLTARKKEAKSQARAYFGPFPSATNVRSVLKMLRTVMPFSDHKLGKKPCIYSQMGLCNPCPSLIVKAEKSEQVKLKKFYLRNIRLLTKILSGKSSLVLNSLTKEMDTYSRNQLFEQAQVVKTKIERLKYITQPIFPADSFIQNPNLSEDILSRQSQELRDTLSKYLRLPRIKRIECFDVAHLAGTKQTASMVTFINAEPEKTLYRHFRLNSNKKADDVASLREVAQRRFRALKAWGRPDLIIVDGGKAQVGVFNEIFSKEGIAVVGIAKRLELLVIPNPKGVMANFVEVRIKPPGLYLVQKIRNEAHRFARRYHHLLLKKSLLP
jgi:excinuclease ABC subunit C